MSVPEHNTTTTENPAFVPIHTTYSCLSENATQQRLPKTFLGMYSFISSLFLSRVSFIIFICIVFFKFFVPLFSSFVNLLLTFYTSKLSCPLPHPGVCQLHVCGSDGILCKDQRHQCGRHLHDPA